MTDDLLTEPGLRPAWQGYFGRGGLVVYRGRCDGCGHIVRLESFDAREYIRLGPVPLWPLARWRVLDWCRQCGFQRRLGFEEYHAWAEAELAPAREALQAAPDDLSVRLALVWRLHGLGRMAEAAAVVAPLLAAGLPSAEANFAAGVVLRAFGRGGEALDSFRAAAAADPATAAHQFELGAALAANRRHQALAEHHLEAAVRLDPRDAAAWRLLAQVRCRRHDWRACVEAWDRASALDPYLGTTSVCRWQSRLARLLARYSAGSASAN